MAGSLRSGSSTAVLLRALVAEADGVEVYDGLADVPMFSPDLDGDPVPPGVAGWRSRLAAADAVVILTPEYAHGVPGSLKNALDWLVSSGTLYGKPVAALSASPSAEGGERALAHLRQTLGALGAVVPGAASFAIPFSRQVSPDGQLTDAGLAERTRAAVAGLADAVGETDG